MTKPRPKSASFKARACDSTSRPGTKSLRVWKYDGPTGAAGRWSGDVQSKLAGALETIQATPGTDIVITLRRDLAPPTKVRKAKP